MDPLCSLHFYAPVRPSTPCKKSLAHPIQVCAIINACFLPFTEGLAPFREFMRVGPLIMLSNASVAFGLNVAAVFLIGAAGGLVLTLAGVFKVRRPPRSLLKAMRLTCHRTSCSFPRAVFSSEAKSPESKSSVSPSLSVVVCRDLDLGRIHHGPVWFVRLQECFGQVDATIDQILGGAKVCYRNRHHGLKVGLCTRIHIGKCIYSSQPRCSSS
jgi:hypothetical protein